MIAVSLDETLREAGAWTKEFNISFPVIFDPSQKIAQEYGAEQIPLNVGIDRQGMVVGGIKGYGEEALEKLAEQLAAL